MLIYPIIYFVICGIIGIILWIKMLNILEKKGKKANNSLVTFRQYIDFYKIIKIEQNLTDRKKFQGIFYGQLLLIIAYFIGMFFLLSTLT